MESKEVWRTIEIDSEVYEQLQNRAQPLVDSANDVLRRLLLKSPATPIKPRASKSKLEAIGGGPLITSEVFVKMLLSSRFGDGFEVVDRFEYMFESASTLVYFQNYNKSDSVLWYRIKERPRQILTTTKKDPWLVFTNPSERSAFVLPVVEVEAAAKRSNWDRDYFEVHIDTRDNRWSELDWDLSKFKLVVKN